VWLRGGLLVIWNYSSRVYRGGSDGFVILPGVFLDFIFPEPPPELPSDQEEVEESIEESPSA